MKKHIFMHYHHRYYLEDKSEEDCFLSSTGYITIPFISSKCIQCTEFSQWITLQTHPPTEEEDRTREREWGERESERERGRERLKKEQTLTREQKIHTILIKPNKSVFDANAAGGKKRSSRQWQWFQNCRVSSFPFLHCCHELSFLFSCKIHNQAQTHACAHTHTHTHTQTPTHTQTCT